VAAFVQRGRPFRAQACRASLGVSTDEPFSRALLNGDVGSISSAKNPKRIYVFSNQAWTKKSVEQLIAEADKWDAESPQSR
jgi:hypothetical protein